MPPNRKKSRQKLIEQEGRIQLAIQDLKSQEIHDIHPAAAAYGVPYGTFRDRSLSLCLQSPNLKPRSLDQVISASPFYRMNLLFFDHLRLLRVLLSAQAQPLYHQHQPPPKILIFITLLNSFSPIPFPLPPSLFSIFYFIFPQLKFEAGRSRR